jgi:RNA polymerase sigma factor (sigma-70 family)
VLADTPVVTCVDVARTSFARASSRILRSALHALGLPHTLVIAQAPAEVAPALPPGALEVALAATSVDALLSTLRPLPTTTEAEARALLAQVQAGQAAQERWEALGQPSSEIGAALAQTIAAGHTAWEWLILSHLRLVVRAARRQPSARVSLEERVQAGLLGLMQAVARSDGRLTRSFVLFAYRAARASVQATLWADQPLRRTTSGKQVARAQRDLQAALGRAPSAEEIAGHTRMHLSTVVAVFGVQGGVVSLDTPLRADESATLAELVADTQTLTPEDLLLAREAAQERRRALGGALAGLEPEARRVLALRFGLEGEPRGVTEVARAMGWSVPRVQQVEAGALIALRERMEGWAGEAPRPAAR